MDRMKEAMTKWLPYSAMAAGISFVVGFVLHVPPPQVITSVGLSAILVFSALVMRSYGRQEKQASNDVVQS